MAFTTEDGTGVEGANSYITTAFADTYHSDRQNTIWAAASTADKEGALIRASEYIDKRFARKFKGYREKRLQGLEWPRLDALDGDLYLFEGIPSQLQKATAEYALRALSLKTLAPDPGLGFNTRDTTGSGTTESAKNASGIMTKVGPVEKEVRYGSSSSQNDYSRLSGSSLVSGYQIPSYPEADLWIEELIESSSSREICLG